MCLVFFVYNTWDNSSKAIDTNLWLQSTERQLKNQNEEYYNELYDRYSRIHRDLNDYQYQTNRRLTSLENRIDRIEESVTIRQDTLSINQTQINGDSNEN